MTLMQATSTIARLGIRLAIAVVCLGAIGSGYAQAPDVERGRRLAERSCARCHDIGLAGDSPFVAAPPFRTLHERYPVEDLTESLAEGISTGHPAMPEFILSVDQIQDFLAYLRSLETGRKP